MNYLEFQKFHVSVHNTHNITSNDFSSYSFTINLPISRLMEEDIRCKFLYQGSNIKHNMLWAFLGLNLYKKDKNGSSTNITCLFMLMASSINSTFKYPPIPSSSVLFGITQLMMSCWNLKLIVIGTFNASLNN